MKELASVNIALPLPKLSIPFLSESQTRPLHHSLSLKLSQSPSLTMNMQKFHGIKREVK